MQKDILDLRELSNAELLNGVRDEASMEYRVRIPEATQANISEVVQNLMNYTPAWNEFINTFVNRIGTVIARSSSWTNPLAVFKKGLMAFGDTVEEYMADMLEAHVYSADRDYGEKVLFGQERPTAQVNFHKVNRENFYKVTVAEKMLRRAFLNEGGLSQLISQIMEAPLKSDQWDEFLAMSNLFREYEANGGFYKVQVPDFSGLTTAQEEARAALKTIKSMSMKLPYLSRDFNAAHMPVSAQPSELMLIGTPDFLASVDVDGLAPIFHIDKADTSWERTVAMPEQYFGIDGCQGILTTKDFFMVFDNLLENRSQPNPAGLYENWFLHHWQIISASRFVPAIMLTADAGTITIREDFSVTAIANPTIIDGDGVTVAGVERGLIYQLDTDVTTDPVGGDVGVAYAVTGNNSNHTYITNQGVLYVGGDESSDTLTITAITTYVDPTNPRLDGLESSVSVTVSGDVVSDWPGTGHIAGITIAGVPVDGVAVATLTYDLVIPEGSVVNKNKVKVDVIGSPDVTKTVTPIDGGYTVVVSVDSGVGAAVDYTVTVGVGVAIP